MVGVFSVQYTTIHTLNISLKPFCYVAAWIGQAEDADSVTSDWKSLSTSSGMRATLLTERPGFLSCGIRK